MWKNKTTVFAFDEIKKVSDLSGCLSKSKAIVFGFDEI